jgi:hypothetical protein
MDDAPRPAAGGSFVMGKDGRLERTEGPGLGYPTPEPDALTVADVPQLGGSYVAGDAGVLTPVDGPALAAVLAKEASADTPEASDDPLETPDMEPQQ